MKEDEHLPKLAPVPLPVPFPEEELGAQSSSDTALEKKEVLRRSKNNTSLALQRGGQDAASGKIVRK